MLFAILQFYVWLYGYNLSRVYMLMFNNTK